MLTLLSSVIGVALSAAPQDPPVADKVRIEGIVVGLDRLPAANCEVWIGDDVPERARIHTDATGHFVLRAPIAQATVIRARLPGIGSGAAWVGLEEHQSIVRVPLWPTRTLRGVVRTSDGAPVAGALVSAVEERLPMLQSPALGTTAADGTFVLGEVLPGAVSLRAGKPGVGATVMAHDGSDTEVVLELDPDELRTLKVRLDAPAEQLARATLHLEARREEWHVPLAAAFANVAFAGKDTIVLQGLPQRARLHVTVSVPGAATTPRSDEMPLGVRDWELAFASAPVVQMRGRVVDATGKGCGDLQLAAVPLADDDPFGLQRPTLARTAADGSFAIAAPVAVGQSAVLLSLSKDWRLPPIAGGDDEGGYGQYVFTVAADAAFEVRAEPTLRMCGRVLDPRGSPVIGAEVWVGRTRQTTVSTDHEGRFEVVDAHGHIEQATNVHVAEPAGFVLATRSVIGTGKVDLGDIQLAPGGAVEGVAMDGAGTPVPGALVWVRDETLYSRVVLADGKGHFEVRGLPVKRCVMSSGADLGNGTPIYFDVVAGQTVRRDVLVP